MTRGSVAGSVGIRGDLVHLVLGVKVSAWRCLVVKARCWYVKAQ